MNPNILQELWDRAVKSGSLIGIGQTFTAPRGVPMFSGGTGVDMAGEPAYEHEYGDSYTSCKQCKRSFRVDKTLLTKLKGMVPEFCHSCWIRSSSVAGREYAAFEKRVGGIPSLHGTPGQQGWASKIRDSQVIGTFSTLMGLVKTERGSVVCGRAIVDVLYQREFTEASTWIEKRDAPGYFHDKVLATIARLFTMPSAELTKYCKFFKNSKPADDWARSGGLTIPMSYALTDEEKP